MVKKSRVSKPRLIIGIILLLLSLGGAGYVWWTKNYQNTPATTASTEKRTEAVKPANNKDATKLYSNDIYSFSYPSKGWSLDKGDESTGNNPSLETDNLTSEPMVVKTGAAIYIRTFPASEGKSYDELVQNPDSLPADIYTDIQKTTVGGLDAHSYTLNYEGTRYITEFARGDTAYQIIFQVAEDQKAQYEGVYKQIVTSFKFK
jgi:hypothetical protein